MSEINLDEGKVKFEDGWYSTGDLTGMIQEKMQTGELKFAAIAAALEELEQALENSHTLEIKLVLSGDEYRRLKELGEKDAAAAVRRAVMAAIAVKDPAGDPAENKAEQGKRPQTAIKCPQCKSPILIASKERPLIIECGECGAAGRLTTENKWAVLDA